MVTLPLVIPDSLAQRLAKLPAEKVHAIALTALSELADAEGKQEQKRLAREKMLASMQRGLPLGGIKINRDELYERD